MVENLPRNHPLFDVLAEIENSEARAKSEKEQTEQLKIKSAQLFVPASMLLNDYGKEQQMGIVRGGVPNIVGASIETVTLLATPAIPFIFQERAFSLFVTQAFANDSPNIGIEDIPEDISIVLGESGGRRELFHIRQDGGVVNWKKERATLEEVDTALRVLRLVRESLKELTPQKASRT